MLKLRTKLRQRVFFGDACVDRTTCRPAELTAATRETLERVKV